MSYTIEYNKQVFYLKEGDQKGYFLFIRQGSNNVREGDTNLRAKDWNLVVSGKEKDLWKQIGKRAGSVNGGGLQKAKGWEETESFTPEEYIQQYRSKIKNAKPLETMLDSFTVRAYIYMRDVFETADKEIETALRAFISKYDMRENGTYYYDKEKRHFDICINNENMLIDFLSNLPEGHQNDFITGFEIHKNIKPKYRSW
jgi:hypothetical protein